MLPAQRGSVPSCLNGVASRQGRWLCGLVVLALALGATGCSPGMLFPHTPIGRRSVAKGHSPPRRQRGSEATPLHSYQPVAAARVGRFEVFQIAPGMGARHRAHDCAELFRSNDGGRSWTRLTAPPVSLDDATIAFADRRVGWLVAGRHTSAGSSTWVTRDGGTRWRRVPVRHVASVIATRNRVYIVARRQLFAGSAADDHLRRLGPGAGNDLFALNGTVYNYDGLPS